MGRLSRWAVHRPVIALVLWFVLVGVVVALGRTLGGSLNDSFSLPATESTTAQAMLEQLPRSGATTATAQIVWSPASGTATDAAAAAVITPLLESVAANPAVACVTTPFAAAPLGSDCPSQGRPDPAVTRTFVGVKQQQEPTAEQLRLMPPEQRAAYDATMAKIKAAREAAAKATSPVSADGRVAYSTVTFTGDGRSVSATDARKILDEVKAANSATMTVGASGQVLEFAGTEPPSSEGIGILVALVILLLAFGSLVAAGMPIFVAVVGLAAGQMLVLLVANVMDVATFAPTVAAMIGLGVGIDYALFVLNRFRQAVHAGHDPKTATLEAVGTAGRAVQFAGGTVIVALLGLFVLRINLLNGIAVAAALTVVMVLLSALWMLPALLSLLGNRSLGLRMPWARKHQTFHPEGGRWAHYGRLIQRRPWLPALLALAVVVVLALPTLSLRLGFADDSGKPLGSPSRTAYDLMAQGFGDGINGPFYVAVELPKPRDMDAYEQVVKELAATPGVASTLPNVAMLPVVAANPTSFSDSGIVGSVLVTPTTSPQDPATSDLLQRLRNETAPRVAETTGARIYVGGFQAVTQDFTTVLTQVLPLFLFIVIGLGFLALMVLFRSLVVPATAAVTSLLSFGAALGITVAVFQWGWASSLLGVSGTGPIFPFLPVMVFAILFGLSMDYQVFLVSRMHEEWVRSGDNGAAVRRGLAGSGRVVAIAAAIMSSVFMAFIPSTNGYIKLFGVALASAVIVDAFVVRLVLVPSVMSLLGRANWWLPGWLDAVLPHVSVEEGADEITDDEPEPIGDPTPVGA